MKRALIALTLLTAPLALTACDPDVERAHEWTRACWDDVRDLIPTDNTKFWGGTTFDWPEPDKVVKVSGTVTADNLYGAEIRSSYWCEVRIDDLTVTDRYVERLDLIMMK